MSFKQLLYAVIAWATLSGCSRWDVCSLWLSAIRIENDKLAFLSADAHVQCWIQGAMKLACDRIRFKVYDEAVVEGFPEYDLESLAIRTINDGICGLADDQLPQLHDDLR